MLARAIHPRGDLAEREPRTLDEQDRQPSIRCQLGALGVGEDRDRATLTCLSGIASRRAP